MRKLKVWVFLSALLSVALGSRAQNYDEALVPKYILPNPLVTTQGKRVVNVKEWEQIRRPEILKLFEDNVYGQMPHDFDSISYQLTNQNKAAMDGRAVLKEIDVNVYRKQQQVIIHVVMFVPAHTKRPSPLFLLINNRDKTNTDPARAIKSDFWPAEQVINAGYAIAAFQVNDLAPDNKDTYTNGVLRLYPEQLTTLNGMKAIGAWAWGAMRVMDYLQTDKLIDKKRIAVVGHSRGGKTALWAMAQDKRFALCFANCSGNTGAALSRRRFGEQVKRINTAYPYWFCDNYKKYNDNVDDLPVDQHMLIALAAPRPVYTTNADKDLWADPRGSYLAIKAAEPVFALYGFNVNFPAEPPPAMSPIIQLPLGYHVREGIHNLTAYDWGNFINFSNKYLRFSIPDRKRMQH